MVNKKRLLQNCYLNSTGSKYVSKKKENEHTPRIQLHVELSEFDEPEFYKQLGSVFNDKEWQQLKSIESSLMDWMRADTKNPAIFAVDPIAAIQEAVPEADHMLVKKLAHMHAVAIESSNSLEPEVISNIAASLKKTGEASNGIH